MNPCLGLWIMNKNINIAIKNNDCEVYLQSCTSNTTKYDILHLLRTRGITKGIYEDRIESELLSNEKGSQPIVQTVNSTNILKLPNGESTTIDGFIKRAQDSYSVIQSGSQSSKEAFIYFCKEDSTVFTLELLRKFTNIFNDPIFGNNIHDIIPYNSEHITLIESGDSLVAKALSAGYLTIDFTGRLTLIPPYTVTEDEMLMEGHLFPVSYGQQDLLLTLRLLKEEFEKEMELPRKKCDELLTKEPITVPKTIAIRHGKQESNGLDAEIIFKMANTKKAEANDYGRVDLKEFTSFVEVKEGDLLLRKRPVQPPVDGYTVWGKLLKAKFGKDIPITTVENVEEKVAEGEIHYIATINGVFREVKNSLTVTEALTIEGDVGVTTGHVRFSKDIVIKGSVLSGYEVECGGNLIIENDVEDGVTINCKGDLSVKNGIFGMNTSITVEGNAEIGFIQESIVSVEGNLHVRSSILHSEITVLGAINVDGEKIDKDKASIIGGTIVTMHSLRTHSLGSIFAKTKVYCGFNPAMHKKHLELNETLKKIDVLLIKIQNSIGFNIRDKHNIKRLAYISDKERKVIKDKLKKLKELSDKKARLTHIIEQIKEKTYAKDTSTLFVQVDNTITPEILLTIGYDREKVKTDLMSVRYYLKEGSITMIDSQWKGS